MVELKQIKNKCIRFSELPNLLFQVYDIDGYDFSENLTLPFDANLGVYIFTQRQTICYKVALNKSSQKNEKEYSAIHKLLYCGKTKDIENRFCEHGHKSDLKGVTNCICIHTCNSQEEIDNIENVILKSHNFTFNKMLNNWTTKEEVMPEEP